MWYQCNSCGKVYPFRSDAIHCHPNISEILEEELSERLSGQSQNTCVISSETAQPRVKSDSANVQGK